MTTTRRTFLKLATATGAVAAASCLAPPGTTGGPPPPFGEGEGEGAAGEGEGEGEGGGQQPPPNSVDCGKSSDLPTGVKQVSGQGILLGRDSGGVYAMSAYCTHAGCDMSGFSGFIEANDDIFCNCHGSTFSPNGDVLGGPAFSPLPHLRVTVIAGEIYVEPDATVSQSTRVAG